MNIVKFFNRLTLPVKLAVFPSFCQICGQPLLESEERVVCRQCLGKIDSHQGPVCQVCGRFLYHLSRLDSLCLDCQENLPPYELHRSLGSYSGRLKEAIILFKYKGKEPLAFSLAGHLYRQFEPLGLLQGVDLIVPVPLHWQKERKRGFNQAELLARWLSRFTGCPLGLGILIKTRNTASQVSLEAGERELNLKGAFAVRKKELIHERIIMLVDDVYTTGTTIKECALILKEAGAREIRAITLARA
ncbi:MAG: ComF family protein [Acidobacteriota bacterium]|nr:ComF family protein [Acidobacteriota bacterium]